MSLNLYPLNPELCTFLGHEETGNQDQFAYPCSNDLANTSVLNHLDDCHVSGITSGGSNQFGLPLDDGNPIEVPDIPDTCFNYITNLLSEEDSDDRPGATLQDYMAAQVVHQSSDTALLGESCSSLANQCPPPVCRNSPFSCFDDSMNMFSYASGTGVTYPSAANFATSSVPNGRLESHSPAPAPAPAPAPVITGGTVTHHQYEQPLHLISFSNSESINSMASGMRSDPIQVVRAEEQRGNSLSVVQGWDRNLYSNIQFEPAFGQSTVAQIVNIASSFPHSSCENINRMVNFQAPINSNAEIAQGIVQCGDSTGKPKGRKHGEGDGRVNQESTERSSKQSAPSNEVFDQIEQYGDVLLCPEGRSKPAGLCSTINKTNNSQNTDDQKLQKKETTSSKGSKKRGSKSQVVDLKSLLSRCAQCVARVDLTGAYELLKQIRQHSSPYGDYLQRVAHYLANGLEARLEGKGVEVTRANEQVAPCEVLKANRVYVASVPFKIMSYYTTNKTIASLVEKAPSIHIIDFGIFYGLQWPCIIQNLSKRSNGPPRIRITGIDFPQRGFRPAERVEETGRCLAKYCERYNVPFEYHAIAKKWEDIQIEDLRIERNEPLVVNCLYRSHNLFDESVVEHSPRDAFLSLVRRINPDIFMHGIVNSTLGVPFFLNRFKEAMFHYTALFDLFEATMRREDNERMLLESKLYGNQALNVIACEGTGRIERAETYKQWQVRTQRAGFVQVPLDRELLRRARAMVRRNFREEFSYDEDDYWVVQGWKGRILYAISCWKPQ